MNSQWQDVAERFGPKFMVVVVRLGCGSQFSMTLGSGGFEGGAGV